MRAVGADHGAAAVLCIEGEMTIYQAGQHKAALLGALGQAALLELDLGAVTELDTAGLQLLMLLKDTARAHGKRLRLRAHSAAVAEVFALAGLAGHFSDPLAAEPIHGS